MFDIDEKIGTWIKEKTGLSTWPYQFYAEFMAHLFGHATLTFVLMSVHWKLGFISFLCGLVKELIIDKHYDNLFANTEDGLDGLTDLTARSIGSLLPFITLLWR